MHTHPLAGKAPNGLYEVVTPSTAGYIVANWGRDWRAERGRLPTSCELLTAWGIPSLKVNIQKEWRDFTPSPNIHPAYCVECLRPLGYILGGGLYNCPDHPPRTMKGKEALFHPFLLAPIWVAAYYIAHARTYQLTGEY